MLLEWRQVVDLIYSNLNLPNPKMLINSGEEATLRLEEDDFACSTYQVILSILKEALQRRQLKALMITLGDYHHLERAFERSRMGETYYSPRDR